MYHIHISLHTRMLSSLKNYGKTLIQLEQSRNGSLKQLKQYFLTIIKKKIICLRINLKPHLKQMDF